MLKVYWYHISLAAAAEAAACIILAYKLIVHYWWQNLSLSYSYKYPIIRKDFKKSSKELLGKMEFWALCNEPKAEMPNTDWNDLFPLIISLRC